MQDSATKSRTQPKQEDTSRIHPGSMGTWRFDYRSSHLTWSSGAHQIFGTDAAMLNGSPSSFLELVHPDDRDELQASIAKAETDQTVIDVEFRIIRKSDGSERQLREHGEIEFDDKGAPLGSSGVVMDVTEQRRTERQIQRNDALHRIVGRLARIGGWYVDLEEDQVHWSDEVCAIHGRPSGTTPSHEDALTHYAPEYRQVIWDAMRDCGELGRPFDLEAEILTAKHRRIAVRVTGEPVRNPSGKIEAVQGALQDLSTQKDTEQELQRQRRQFSALANSLPIIVWSADPDGTLNYTNMVMDDYTGSHDLALPSDSWTELVHPEDLQATLEAWSDALASGRRHEVQFRLRRHDGEYRWHKISAGPSTDSDGRIESWYGAAIDVHDQVKLEEEQRALAERLSNTLESITDAFYTVDPQWRFTHVNAEAERLLKRHRRDLIGRNLWEAFPEAAHTELFTQYTAALETGKKVKFEIYYAPLSTWFDVTAYPSESGLAVYFQDVNRRHERDAQLRLFETAMNHLSDFVIFTEAAPLDEPGPRITYVNEAFERSTGYRPDEVIGQSPRLFQGPATDRTELDRVRHALEQQEPVRVELCNYRKDGSTFWVEIEIVPIAAEGAEFTHFVSVQRDVTDRKGNEEALRQSEERFRTVSQVATDAIWDWKIEEDRVWTSESFTAIFGHEPSEVATIQQWLDLIHPSERDTVERKIMACVSGQADTWSAEYRFLRADGEYKEVMDRGAVIRASNGTAVRMLGGMTDLTEQKTLRQRLDEVQRLEAVGQLTGGVAHDFNNLLTVILGNTEALSEDLSDDQYLASLARVAKNAAERGAQLTQHLLAFARQQPLEPADIDISQVLGRMRDLLRRTIRENIEIDIGVTEELWPAFADPGQLENVILNLVLNGRDAIPDSGKITIEAYNAVLDAEYAARNQDVSPGHYVVVSVSDDGVGMAPEVLEKVFEPFFTTKEFGAGNGLGMSMVFGFVKQSNGHIKIYSEPGMGTTVRVYLPCGQGATSNYEELPMGSTIQGHGQTILVVEDDAMVRDVAQGHLERLGYTVHVTTNGQEALQWIKTHGAPDLLFTDVVMPGALNGRQLAEAANEIEPGLPVLFTSGYTENAIIHQGRLDAGVQLLSKPYSRRELALKVRSMIDRSE